MRGGPLIQLTAFHAACCSISAITDVAVAITFLRRTTMGVAMDIVIECMLANAARTDASPTSVKPSENDNASVLHRPEDLWSAGSGLRR
jgi:hypothetical protein